MSEDTADSFVGGLVQVSHTSADLYEGLDNLVALGIGPFMIFTASPENTEDLTYMGEPAELSFRFAFAVSDGMMWEVVQPLEGPSIFRDFLDAGHAGLQHVGVTCNEIPYEERAAGLSARGYKYVLGGRAFNGQVKFGYFHNGNAEAPTLEIFEFPEGFAPEPEEWYPTPPG